MAAVTRSCTIAFWLSPTLPPTRSNHPEPPSWLPLKYGPFAESASTRGVWLRVEGRFTTAAAPCSRSASAFPSQVRPSVVMLTGVGGSLSARDTSGPPKREM
jgi:hypothetical protein